MINSQCFDDYFDLLNVLCFLFYLIYCLLVGTYLVIASRLFALIFMFKILINYSHLMLNFAFFGHLFLLHLVYFYYY